MRLFKQVTRPLANAVIRFIPAIVAVDVGIEIAQLFGIRRG